MLESESGVRVDDEIFVNAQYGYDIRCEAVAEKGTVSLADQNVVDVRDGSGHRNRVARDHNDRFWGAFVTEVQEWIDAVSAGQGAVGPSAWDGYAAQVVCDAGVNALYSGDRVEIDLGDKPALYS